MNYIESVKEAIRKSKITQRQLADSIGVTLDQLTNILNGRTALKIPVRKSIDDYFYDEHDIDLTSEVENLVEESSPVYKTDSMSKLELVEKCNFYRGMIDDLKYHNELLKDSLLLVNNQYEHQKDINEILVERLKKYEIVELSLITSEKRKKPTG